MEEILIQAVEPTPAERLTTIQAELAAIDRAAEGFKGRLTQARADLQRIDSDLSAHRVRRGDLLAAGEDPKIIDRELTQAEKERLNQIDLIAGCERALLKSQEYRKPIEVEAKQLQAELDKVVFAELLETYNTTLRSAAGLFERIMAADSTFKSRAPVLKGFRPNGDMITILRVA
jgi:chromosome segregation ATPase